MGGIKMKNHKENHNSNIYGIALMILCAVCLCTGQFVWKRYDGLISVLVGFAIYCLGALAMLTAYRFGKLSVLQPINSIGYIVSAILGAVFFQERITIGKVIGIVIIMTGVVLLTREEHEP